MNLAHPLKAQTELLDEVLFRLSAYCDYVLTYLLTPQSRVLFEKLTGFAANQEIPAFYGTRKFITVLTSARHLSLS